MAPSSAPRRRRRPAAAAEGGALGRAAVAAGLVAAARPAARLGAQAFAAAGAGGGAPAEAGTDRQPPCAGLRLPGAGRGAGAGAAAGGRPSCRPAVLAGAAPPAVPAAYDAPLWALRLGRRPSPARLDGREARAAAAAGAVAEAAEAPEVPLKALAVQGSLFIGYFCLQSGMSFYMKWLLSQVSVAKGLSGVPAPFLVTACQQLVGFALFGLFFAGSRLVGRPYQPKRLASQQEWLLVLALSVSFTMNIGLNLLSLSLVSLSLTMIVRACSPLSTAFMQSMIMRTKKQDISPGEWACLSVGVVCAAVVVIAQSGGPTGAASFAFFFGVAVSVSSLFAGGLDFVFKGILGSEVKLNALDTTCYMALPVALLTTLLSTFVSKPVSPSWARTFGMRSMTDCAVLAKLWQVNPKVLVWVLLSGVLAFCYNTFVTFLVVELSPATTAFAGNFNKAATILVSLLLLEGNVLTAGPRGLAIVAAVMGNIAAFTLYNVLKRRRPSKR